MGGNPPRPSALNCSGSSDSRWHLSADFQSKCDLYLQAQPGMETPLDVLSRAASLVHADDEKRLPNSHITHPDDVKFLVKVMFNQAPAPLIRKWRQREIMKPVQDYNTASLLQEMCRRRSHVPQKADFSLVKDCQSWRGKATVSFTSHSRLPQMFANSFRGR
ncbi:uncharacterized protein LOC144373238 isoform X4 [Ictidomys tridecemlineatus]